ncbi:NUDIX hydrolase [Candidatus Wolfebacteria bacterium]|nr:NUDIX hydrolase [Candidatus Wolfebacteria bacterium]
MYIRSHLTNDRGEKLEVRYYDADSRADIKHKHISGVHACCFYKGRLVIVYAESKGRWSLPGGGVEVGESVEEAVVREVREETNMNVLRQTLIGYQEIVTPDGVVVQTRSACIVEPYGDFVADPDGEITKTLLIEPSEYRQYFDWGEVGERVMARALEFFRQAASS